MTTRCLTVDFYSDINNHIHSALTSCSEKPEQCHMTGKKNKNMFKTFWVRSRRAPAERDVVFYTDQPFKV